MSKSQEWRQFVPVFALPTLILALLLFLSFGAVVAAVYFQRFSLWTGFALNSVICYLNFTVLHEAVHGNITIKIRAVKHPIHISDT